MQKEIPLACSLPEQALVSRRDELNASIFRDYRQTQELTDGYAFQYPGSPEWITKLAEFVAFERQCCQFFTFELVFEPQQGPIWLRLRGDEGVKDFIKTELTKL